MVKAGRVQPSGISVIPHGDLNSLSIEFVRWSQMGAE